MKRRKRFKVGISKMYFPQSLWPDNNYFAYQVVTVLAYDRLDAAEVAWKVYGTKWLSQMFPHPLDVKVYAIQAKPARAIRNSLPITVYKKER